MNLDPELIRIIGAAAFFLTMSVLLGLGFWVRDRQEMERVFEYVRDADLGASELEIEGALFIRDAGPALRRLEKDGRVIARSVYSDGMIRNVWVYRA